MGTNRARLACRSLLPALSAGILLASVAKAGINEWTSLGPEGGVVNALAIDPSNPSTIYVGTPRGGVFKSLDGGTSWAAVNNGLTTPFVLSLAIDPTRPSTIYAGGAVGVFKSVDGAEHWNLSSAGLPIGSVRALAIDPANPSILYAGFDPGPRRLGGGAYKSVDGGIRWSFLGEIGAVWALGVNPQDPAILFASVSQLIGGILRGTAYRSGDGGVTWSLLPDLTFTGGGVNQFSIDRASSQVYAATFNGVWKSSDGRVAWRRSSAGLTADDRLSVFFPDVRSVVIDPATPSVLSAATLGGGVFRSVDAGETWAALNRGLANRRVTALAIDASSSSTLYAGTDGNGLFRIEVAPGLGLCEAGASMLCLNDGRFRVAVNWGTPNGVSGTGKALPISSDTGGFWFFSPNNIELGVKVVDGRAFNNKFWVFYGALSNVEYTITVTDTVTGNVKTYFNLSGQTASVADTTAF